MTRHRTAQATAPEGFSELWKVGGNSGEYADAMRVGRSEGYDEEGLVILRFVDDGKEERFAPHELFPATKEEAEEISADVYEDGEERALAIGEYLGCDVELLSTERGAIRLFEPTSGAIVAMTEDERGEIKIHPVFTAEEFEQLKDYMGLEAFNGITVSQKKAAKAIGAEIYHKIFVPLIGAGVYQRLLDFWEEVQERKAEWERTAQLDLFGEPEGQGEEQEKEEAAQSELF